VFDGGQLGADIGAVVVAEVHRIGVADGPQQVAGECVEPVEQAVDGAKCAVEIGGLPVGVGVVVGLPQLLGGLVEVTDQRIMRGCVGVVGHADSSSVRNCVEGAGPGTGLGCAGIRYAVPGSAVDLPVCAGLLRAGLQVGGGVGQVAGAGRVTLDSARQVVEHDHDEPECDQDAQDDE
jgi:hypothetical protein